MGQELLVVLTRIDFSESIHDVGGILTYGYRTMAETAVRPDPGDPVVDFALRPHSNLNCEASH